MLDRLVEDVLASNTTIVQARARLNAVRADARLAAADSAPQLGVEGGVSQAGGPLINAAGGSGSLFTARASLSWEVDISGRLSSERFAARLDAAAAEAMLRYTRMLIAVDAVQCYWRAQFLAAAAELASERVALGERQLDRIRRRQAHGLAASDELFAAASDLAKARGEFVEIERQRKLSQHELQFLAGTSEPIALVPAGLTNPPEVPSGLPSTMLAQRPDIAAAEAEFQAADKRLAAARKSWLPSFSLTASGGAASPSLGQILASTAQSFGLNLLFGLPLFDGGRHKALVGRSRAELDLAAARYGERVLGALREVNDALANVSAARHVYELASEEALNSQNLYASALAGAKNGLQSEVAVERRKIAAIDGREALLAANFARYDAALQVIRSLGGGWAASTN